VLLSEGQAEPTVLAAGLQALVQHPHVQVEWGGHSAKVATHAPQVVLSPGIPPHSGVVQHLLHQQQPPLLFSEVEWAYRQAPSSLRWVGITGSNGKTTITQLLTHLLNHPTNQGALPAVACGNVGFPVASAVQQAREGVLPPATTLVAELSSYQLAYSHGLCVDIGVWSNLSPDHIPWHGSLEAYKTAKSKLFVGAMAARWAVLNVEDEAGAQWAQERQACGQWVLAYGQSVASVATYPNRLWVETNPDDPEGGEWLMLALQPRQLNVPPAYRQALEAQALKGQADAALPLVNVASWPLPGVHNLQNLLAAVGAAVLAGVPIAALQQGVACFSGVEHRCEPVPNAQGYTVWNDSKATNPEACQVALQSLPTGQVLLLAGGEDKGTPLEAWAQTVREQCWGVVLQGACQARFKAALVAAGFDETRLWQTPTLQEAIALVLRCLAENPQLHLLFSPAAASFDQFSHFEERGQCFKQWIQQPLA
jgi:UDP-N-acetylmuramoylalanine--D-glutamate ligase